MFTANIFESLFATWPGFTALLALLIITKLIAWLFFTDRFGDMRVLSALRGLDPAAYRHFHDLQLPHPDGSSSIRIEHLVVSHSGVFIIETTNRRGWISGSENEPEWVQFFHCKRSHFKNPLQRNQAAVEALSSFLNLPDPAFLPVLVFMRDCEMKAPLPGILAQRSLIPWIRRQKATLLDPHSVSRTVARLEALQHALKPEAADKLQIHTLHVRQAV